MKSGLALLSLFAQSAGCTRPPETMHASGGAPALGGEGGSAQLTLVDLLPIALRLDCSGIGDTEAPSELYVRIAQPSLQDEPLEARVEGALCAEHDVGARADAPAVALRCPQRQLRHDAATPCFDHRVNVAVCSPGFAELSLVLQNPGPCSSLELPAPSCADLEAGVTRGYAYEQVVYELEPLAPGAADCPSFVEPPQAALADESLYACPCSPAGQ